MRTRAIVIALALAMVAPAAARDPANPRSTTDDMLATAVSTSLTDDPMVSAMQVKVAADGGVVTLTGEVPSAAEREAAERAANRVAGVREVRNRLTIADRIAPGTSPIPERPAP